MPPSVSVHTARLTLIEVTDDGFARQDDDTVSQSCLLATANVEVILYCITSASLFIRRDYDAALKQRIEKVTGLPVLIAAQTVIGALRALGADRIALATPFVPDGTGRAQLFLEAKGFEVLAAGGLGYTINFAIATIEPEAIRRLVRTIDRKDAEAILIPGGNMSCLSLVAEMEAELGKPVVTTNAAGIWAFLRQFDVTDPIQGTGQLLRDLPP